jgi:hypothetical protein
MSFKLDKIQMIKASCLSFSVNKNPSEEIKGFLYDYSTQTKADTENKLIFIQLKIDISATLELEENKFKAGTFEFGFTYQVENLDELIQISDEHRTLDKVLHMSIMGIAFSTARGIIITRAANTFLENAFLPIVNPSNLLDLNYVI